MKVKDILESRAWHSLSMSKDQIADITDDLAVDGVIPKRLTPKEIPDQLAVDFENELEKMDDAEMNHSDMLYDIVKQLLAKY